MNVLPKDRDERINLGKRIYAGEFGSISAAAKHFDTADHNIYTVLNLFKKSAGIPKGPPRNSKKAKSNGHDTGTAIAVIPDVNKLLAENAALREQLEHALEEAHTLQSLLMTVGKTLG